MRHPAIALALLVAGSAHADISQPPSGLAHRPVPRDQASALAVPKGAPAVPGPVQPLADAPIDVALDEESVVVDAWPTLLLVRGTFVLRAGERGAEGLRVGFPLEETSMSGSSPVRLIPGEPPAQPEHFLYSFSGLPVEDLQVTIDGRPTYPSEDPPTKRLRHLLEPGAAKGRGVLATGDEGRWRVWTMGFSPRQSARVELSYSQPLSDNPGLASGFRAITFRDPLLSSGLWSGKVRQAELRLRLHGLDPARVRAIPEPKKDGADLVWAFADLDATTELVSFEVPVDLALPPDARRGPAPYDVAALSARQKLVDRLARFGRVGAEDGKAAPQDFDGLAELVADLREAAAGEGPERELARSELLGLGALLGKADEPSCARWLTPPGSKLLDEPSSLEWLAYRARPAVADELRHACQLRKRTRLAWAASAGVVALAAGLALALLARRRKRAERSAKPTP